MGALVYCPTLRPHSLFPSNPSPPKNSSCLSQMDVGSNSVPAVGGAKGVRGMDTRREGEGKNMEVINTTTKSFNQPEVWQSRVKSHCVINIISLTYIHPSISSFLGCQLCLLERRKIKVTCPRLQSQKRRPRTVPRPVTPKPEHLPSNCNGWGDADANKLHSHSSNIISALISSQSHASHFIDGETKAQGRTKMEPA